MYITGIEKGKGQRFNVYNEEGLVFALYAKELKAYHIKENQELDDDIADMILTDIVYKRAKERALYLLERKMYTVFMMKEKLMLNDYPQTVIHRVLAFLEQYHYLDDKEYAGMYIRDYSSRKSKKQIVLDLYRKGIDKQLVQDYFLEHDYSEEECFARQFEHYTRGKDLTDYSIRQKIFRYFYGKGFSTYLINDYLQHACDI